MTNNDEAPRSGVSFRALDVVVVDDDAATLEFLRIGLREHRISVRTARNVREGIARIRESIPDVVVSDLDLRDSLGGVALAEALRNHEHTRQIPLVVITGAEATEGAALKMFDAHLRKPVDLGVLIDVIQRAVEITKPIRRPRVAG